MLIVTAGVFVLSFDALLVRLAQTSAWNVVFWRGMFIALSLVLFLLLTERGDWLRPFRTGGRAVLVAGLVAGVGAMLFPISVMHTSVANTVVLLSAAPFFAALFTWLFLGERVRPRTWIAIAVILLGVLAVFSGSLTSGGLTGDVAALMAAATFGANMTWLRAHPHVSRIASVCISGIVGAMIAWPLATPLALSTTTYQVLAFSGLLQMPVAMVLVSLGTRYLPAPEVALLILIETLLGPLWVWLALGELPPAATFVGGTLIVVTIAVHSWLALRGVRLTAGSRPLSAAGRPGL